MLEKILGLFGFNTGENYIGLHRLNDDRSLPQAQPVSKAKEELKLSDLMRNN